MLIDFIKIPKVKELICSNFEYIKISKPSLDNITIDNPSIIGNAIELYINCLFDKNHSVSKKHYQQNNFPIIINEHYIKPLENLKKETISNFYEFSKSIDYLKDKFEIGINQLLNQDFTKKMKIESLSNIIQKIEIIIPNKNIDSNIIGKISAYQQAVYTLNSFIDNEYRKYLQLGTITKDFIRQFLLIAQISPALNFNFYTKFQNKATENDYKAFETIVGKIPKNFYKNISKMNYHQKLGFGFVNAIPDFVTNNSIIEVKCTKDFYTKSHFCQAIGYYLIYLHNINRINTKNTSVDIRRLSKIKRIIIYYALYGVMVEISMNKITNKIKMINAYNEFMEFAKLNPTHWINHK